MSHMDEVARQLAKAIKTVRESAQFEDGSKADLAMVTVEQFCAVALRVMQKANPSKVASVARTFEIKCRLDGLPFVEMS